MHIFANPVTYIVSKMTKFQPEKYLLLKILLVTQEDENIYCELFYQ